MARAVIIPLPASGHVNPTLPVARELVARGEDVCYCLPEPFRSAVQVTGATLLPLTITGQGFRWSAVPCADLLLWLPVHSAVTSLEILSDLLNRIRAEQPDYIIYDAWCLWGRLAAHILHLPAIRCQPTFVMDEHMGPAFQTMIDQADRLAMPRISQTGRPGSEQLVTFRDLVEHICDSYNVPMIDLKDFFTHAEALNIVPIPRAFQPGGETFDDRFHFVGPSIRPPDRSTDFPLDQLKQPTLYISLGTVCNDEEAFYKTCFAAFGKRSSAPSGRHGRQPWQVVLATGKSHLSNLGSPPDNFVLRSHVPQIDVLERSSIFVTHGGMNSAMEGVYYGVPFVVVPQMLEQRITARRMEELGLGIALDSDRVTVDLLREAVARVANEPAFRTKMQHMQNLVRESDGGRSAADAIMHFTRTTGQKLWSWPSRTIYTS